MKFVNQAQLEEMEPVTLHQNVLQEAEAQVEVVHHPLEFAVFSKRAVVQEI